MKFMLPMIYFDDGNKHDPLSALRGFSGAKLIIHASRDEFTSIDEVKGIYSELFKPKEHLWIECTHDYRLFPEVVNQINQSLEEFLKHMK